MNTFAKIQMPEFTKGQQVTDFWGRTGTVVQQRSRFAILVSWTTSPDGHTTWGNRGWQSNHRPEALTAVDAPTNL